MRKELMLSTEAQNIGQDEYDDIQMAIQKLSSASQAQFEEIKKEKWYNRLWDMVTFSQKGKKRLAEQIGTVAQAQQILVEMLLRLSDQDRNIAELVMKNSSYIERIQRDNIYLLTEINLLKDRIADLNVKVKYDANIKDLNDEEKRALSGCLYNLVEQYDSPSDRQKEYGNTILKIVDENTRMENPFKAIEDFDNKTKGKLLACCMEYMFLENYSTDGFTKHQDFIDEFDCGKKTIADIKDQIVSIFKARGEQGFIDRYRKLDKEVSPLFYVDFEEEETVEEDYDEINRHGIAALNNKNYEEAARLFKIAADHGHADAQNRYGVRLSNGQGVAKDDKEAVRYFIMAAHQGHDKAMDNLAVYYRERDEKAKELLLKAAKQGEENAIKDLWDWYGIWAGAVSEEVIGDETKRDEFRPQSMVEIPRDKSIRIINKIINVTSFIKLVGRLQLEKCVVYYNGDSARGEIELSDSAVLSIKDTTVICKGYNEKPLVKSEGNQTSIEIDGCTFSNCNYLMELNRFNKFAMSDSHIVNAGGNLLSASQRSDTSLSIDNCFFELNGLSDFNKKDSFLTVIRLWRWSDAKAYMIRNCLFKQTADIKDSDGNALRYTFIEADYAQINNCTAIGLHGRGAAFKNALFFDDIFIDSEAPVKLKNTSDGRSKIDNCLFKHCREVLELDENSIVSNCQFVSCEDHVINGEQYGGSKIEYCEFVNTSHKSSSDNRFSYNACLIFRRSKGKAPSVNKMEHCIFNGADVGDWLLIDIAGYEKPAGNVLQIENCDFRNCRTSRKTLLGEYIYYTGLFNSSNSFNGVYKIGCTGLDNTNGSGHIDMSPDQFKTTGSDGNTIGMWHSEEEMLLIAGSLDSLDQ